MKWIWLSAFGLWSDHGRHNQRGGPGNEGYGRDQLEKDGLQTILLLIVAVAYIVIIGSIASRKGRSAVGWIIFCMLFQVIGLLALAYVPSLREVKCPNCGNTFEAEEHRLPKA